MYTCCGLCSYGYHWSQNMHLCLSWQHGTSMNRWSESAFMVPWKRRVILVDYSSNYWCPSSLCIINFFMVLRHQREILLRSKTRSVGYCNQVEELLKCLGKALQMVMKKRWPPVGHHKVLQGSLRASSWEGNIKKKKEQPIFPSR